jgi:hypothetical protein
MLYGEVALKGMSYQREAVEGARPNQKGAGTLSIEELNSVEFP